MTKHLIFTEIGQNRLSHHNHLDWGQARASMILFSMFAGSDANHTVSGQHSYHLDPGPFEGVFRTKKRSSAPEAPACASALRLLKNSFFTECTRVISACCSTALPFQVMSHPMTTRRSFLRFPLAPEEKSAYAARVCAHPHASVVTQAFLCQFQ